MAEFAAAFLGVGFALYTIMFVQWALRLIGRIKNAP